MILLLSDGTFIFVHNDLFVCLTKLCLMGLWVRPFGRPQCSSWKCAHEETPRDSLSPCFQKTGSHSITFWRRKNPQVKIKGSFCVLGRHVLPLVLYLSPVPSCYSLQPIPLCPQTSHHLSIATEAGSRLLRTPPRTHAKLPRHCSHLCSLSHSPSTLRVPWAFWGATIPLSSWEAPSDSKCNNESKAKWAAPLPASVAGWNTLYVCR